MKKKNSHQSTSSSVFSHFKSLGLHVLLAERAWPPECSWPRSFCNQRPRAFWPLTWGLLDTVFALPLRDIIGFTGPYVLKWPFVSPTLSVLNNEQAVAMCLAGEFQGLLLSMCLPLCSHPWPCGLLLGYSSATQTQDTTRCMRSANTPQSRSLLMTLVVSYLCLWATLFRAPLSALWRRE